MKGRYFVTYYLNNSIYKFFFNTKRRTLLYVENLPDGIEDLQIFYGHPVKYEDLLND